MAGEFWLSNGAWVAIAPLLPTNQPARGGWMTVG